MKIKPNVVGDVEAVRAARRVETKEVAKPSPDDANVGVANSASQSDTLNVSARAAYVGKLTESAHQTPEIRQERVESLRTQIASDAYQPSAEQIADAILKSE